MKLFKRSERSEEADEPGRRYLELAPPGERTDHLAIACIQRTAADPITAGDRLGTVVRPAELGRISDVVREVMRQDRDLSAWIVRKAAVIFNRYLTGAMTGDIPERLGEAFAAMGLEVGDDGARVIDTSAGDLGAEDVQAAREAGTIVLALMRIVATPADRRTPSEREFYANLYTGADGQDVEQLAYELVAWISIVLGRLKNAGKVDARGVAFDPRYREPVKLWTAGWYPNPPRQGDTGSGDAEFQRYWEGQWTSRVRARQDDGSFHESELSLHGTPVD